MSNQRHPLGRRCGDKKSIMLVMVLMPYALVRYGFDCLRGKP